MKYTVILFDPLKIDYTETVNKLFEETRKITQCVISAENDLCECGYVNYIPGSEIHDKYKSIEQDYLRIKTYEIPEGTNVRSTAGAYWEKSSISKRYQKPLRNWR